MQEEECQKIYRKDCYIESVPEAKEQSVEICQSNFVRNCDLVVDEFDEEEEEECSSEYDTGSITDKSFNKRSFNMTPLFQFVKLSMTLSMGMRILQNVKKLQRRNVSPDMKQTKQYARIGSNKFAHWEL